MYHFQIEVIFKQIKLETWDCAQMKGLFSSFWLAISNDLLHGYLGRQIPKTAGCVFFLNLRRSSIVYRAENSQNISGQMSSPSPHYGPEQKQVPRGYIVTHCINGYDVIWWLFMLKNWTYLSFKNNAGHTDWRTDRQIDQRTDRWKDKRTNQQTDSTSYRNA